MKIAQARKLLTEDIGRMTLEQLQRHRVKLTDAYDPVSDKQSKAEEKSEGQRVYCVLLLLLPADWADGGTGRQNRI